MASAEESKLIDELEALTQKFRQAQLKGKPKTSTNPRARRPKHPQFSKGDRVRILTADHCNKEATVQCVRGEQQWWVRMDDCTELHRKCSSLKRAIEPKEKPS